MINNEEVLRAMIRMCIKMAKMLEDEEEAEKVQILFPNWENQEDGKEVKAGEFYRCNGELYKVEQDHKLDKKNRRPDEESDELFKKTNKERHEEEKKKREEEKKKQEEEKKKQEEPLKPGEEKK